MNESKIVYGKPIMDQVKSNLEEYIKFINEKNRRLPHLVTILVGNDYASKKYVNLKNKDCQDVGIKTTPIEYNEDVSEFELINRIEELNNDNTVDGILVQLPLPSHIDENRVMETIKPSKDVDCFNPINVGKMYIGNPYLLPCTPAGIDRILEYMGYHSLEGMKAVVIGRSNIVGKPTAKLLMDKNATVTICHSKTKNIKDEVRQADIVVAATGKAKMIKSDWLKEGAIVIDVGINTDENGNMCGDVDFDDVIDKVKFITPVPKGMGIVTRAMLLENTLLAYKENIKPFIKYSSKDFEDENTIRARQYAQSICELFEDILEKHDITIPDPDRNSQGEGEEAARIYGETYFNLEDEITNMITEMVNKVKRDEIEVVSDTY